MRVWGIEYTIKSGDKWLSKWIGPCGVCCMSFRDKLGEDAKCFMGRPVFFRTRELAREEAKKQTKERVKSRAIPIELIWKRVSKGA